MNIIEIAQGNGFVSCIRARCVYSALYGTNCTHVNQSSWFCLGMRPEVLVGISQLAGARDIFISYILNRINNACNMLSVDSCLCCCCLLPDCDLGEVEKADQS